MRFSTTSLLASSAWLACTYATPEAIAAPQLVARASGSADPSVIGYFSGSGGFSNGRICDYPQTVSTSGSYAQCCAATSACDFYTACSANTLMAASTSVPCNAVGLCNTAVLAPTVGASSGVSNLACWEPSLGSSAFTLYQNIGSATVVAATSAGSSASGSTGGSSGAAATSGSSAGSAATVTGSTAAATASASPSKAEAAGVDMFVTGGGLFVAALAVLQAML